MKQITIEGAAVHAERLVYDSRAVRAGDCFFALRGETSDGHAFIGAAIEKGATTVVCEQLPLQQVGGIRYIVTADTHMALAQAAAEFYGHPSAELKLVGVTGTNGKTTVATLLYDLFRKLGFEAGLISTVVYKVGPDEQPSTHTTPDPIVLNRLLRQMVDKGCQYAFMEVSSHALVQRRAAALTFAGGIFTNLTHDHLDYHGTLAAYRDAKKSFFDGLPKGSFALVNADDRNATVMVQNTKAAVKTYSLRQLADFRARIVEADTEGMELRIDHTEVWVRFLGRFNAANLLAVYGAGRLLGADKEEILTAMSTLTPVAGRFEFVRSTDGRTAVVDYAHTPDALEKALKTLDELKGGGRLIVVVGCGGDRDRTKRPEMARIACAGAQVAIFTADNPRTEDAEKILDDMVAGLSPADKYIRITDRAEAIRAAAMMAGAEDLILVAGKGHETYQITGTEKHHFDDREELKKALN